MERIKYRAVIEYLYLKSLTPVKIKEELDEVYEDSAPSYATVKNWVAEFKRGRRRLTDEHRSGRPKTAITDDAIEKVHDMVVNNRRIKVREIAKGTGISQERVWKILNEGLGLKKVSARWVPCFLSEDIKHNRINISKALLERFQQDEEDFLSRFITVDETWIHLYKPEAKEGGKNGPKKVKVVESVDKIMATVFWDSQGVVLIDYLESDRTVTGSYYAALLNKLKAAITEKRPYLQTKQVLFFQDDAPAHTSTVAMAAITELQFEVIDHPPYSPDLSPSDYFLYPHLKIWLNGQRFSSSEEAISAVGDYFQDLDASHYLEGLEKLELRWEKCIELQGDYVDK